MCWSGAGTGPGDGSSCSALAASRAGKDAGRGREAQPSPADVGHDSQCGKHGVSASRGKLRPSPAPRDAGSRGK